MFNLNVRIVPLLSANLVFQKCINLSLLWVCIGGNMFFAALIKTLSILLYFIDLRFPHILLQLFLNSDFLI